MSDIKDVEVKRLVKLIEKAPKGMPEAPEYSIKSCRCHRCGGAGGAKEWPGFTCYRCLGSGVDPSDKNYKVDLDGASEEWKAWAVEIIAKRDATNEKRRATKEAKKAAEDAKLAAEELNKREEYIEANPVLKEAVGAGVAFSEADNFAATVLESILRNFSMSEKQEDIVKRGLVKITEKAAEDAMPKVPVIEGRIEIIGIVKATKWQENEQYGGSLKMLVLDDRGFKVWGTVPSSLNGVVSSAKEYCTGVDRGDRVKFTATVEKSPDDEYFGFYKRPTKAVMEKAA